MRTKYPRTPHLPWSPGATGDDVRLADVDRFEGREVVVTEKLDGENTTLYRDGLHARSLDSAHHPSRTWVKALHARIAASLPDDVRVCGESLAARHSIAYADLDGFFYAFSVWRGDTALSWDDTVAFAHARGLPTPRVLYRGTFDRKRIRALKVHPEREEGYVVRLADAFAYADFGASVAKWVRPGHVTTDAHWMLQEVVPNGLSDRSALWTVRSGGSVDGDALGRLVGGMGSDVDLPVLGDRRLAVVLAGRLHGAFRSELLPALVEGLGLGLARRVADLVGLHGLLHRDIDEEARRGGLISLARCVDLAGLHALAEATAEDVERVRWSRLVAEDAGLLEDDPFAAYRRALADPDPDVHAYRLGEALDRLVAGSIASPEEAVAATHGLRPTGTLSVLIGPSGSGKSTVARALGRPVIELDALREQPGDPLAAGLKRLDEVKGAAVWDATSLTRQQRDLPVRIARQHGCLVELVPVLVPRPVAEARNRGRRRTVPADVVDRQWHRIRWPYGNEAHRIRWEVPRADE
ncbi:MAG: AAA family ATPase [Alphaproteobacteria bacterium]|nr:AAA family ATPase [Alphaproteobacteria bacterium]